MYLSFLTSGGHWEKCARCHIASLVSNSNNTPINQGPDSTQHGAGLHRSAAPSGVDNGEKCWGALASVSPAAYGFSKDTSQGAAERAEAHDTEQDSSRRFACSQRGCFVNAMTQMMATAAAINYASDLAFSCQLQTGAVRFDRLIKKVFTSLTGIY